VAVLFSPSTTWIPFTDADSIIVLPRHPFIALGAPAGCRNDRRPRGLSRLRRDYHGWNTNLPHRHGADAFYSPRHILFDSRIQSRRAQSREWRSSATAAIRRRMKSIHRTMTPTAGESTFEGPGSRPGQLSQISRMGMLRSGGSRIFSELTVVESSRLGLRPPRENVPTWTTERLARIFPNLASIRPVRAPVSGGEHNNARVSALPGWGTRLSSCL